MIKRAIIISLIILILIGASIFLGNAQGDNKDKKDKDSDGIPDYLDTEKNDKYSNETSNETSKDLRTFESSEGSCSNGLWSVEYGSSSIYGAYIKRLYWNNTYYVNVANVPWIKINGAQYTLHGDFTFYECGHSVFTNYCLIYHHYYKSIEQVNHTLEVLWYLWKNPINNTAKLDVKVVHSTYDHRYYELFAPFRFDFDIINSGDDIFYVYGSISGWNQQNIEAYQFNYNPVDPVWGMKLKQVEYTNMNCWAGIKAWGASEKNYLLRFHTNEYKGDPDSYYINLEDTYRKDNVIWTTASTIDTSPRCCGPIAYLH